MSLNSAPFSRIIGIFFPPFSDVIHGKKKKNHKAIIPSPGYWTVSWLFWQRGRQIRENRSLKSCAHACLCPQFSSAFPAPNISISALYSSISLLICISPHSSLPISLGQSSLRSHVGQSHLGADGEGVPVQVHLHIGCGPEQIPLCQRDGRDRLGAAGARAPVAAHRGEAGETAVKTK